MRDMPLSIRWQPTCILLCQWSAWLEILLIASDNRGSLVVGFFRFVRLPRGLPRQASGLLT